MKKTALLLLTVFYLLVATGVEVKAHYCCGKLAGIKLVLVEEGATKCCCEKKAKKNCCKDKTAFVKVSDSHQFTASVFSFTQPSFSIVDTLLNSFTFQKSHIVASSFSVPRKRSWRTLPLFLAMRVLRL